MATIFYGILLITVVSLILTTIKNSLVRNPATIERPTSKVSQLNPSFEVLCRGITTFLLLFYMVMKILEEKGYQIHVVIIVATIFLINYGIKNND